MHAAVEAHPPAESSESSRSSEPSDDTRLGELRQAFLGNKGFVGDDDPHRWIEWVRLGPLPIPVPNPPSRPHALKLHDLHHILTGYGTDWRGEYQISGWEVGAGLYRNPVAWMFCLLGLAAGLVVCPRLTVRAYARGRQGRTLLGQDPTAAQAMTLAEGHAFCGTRAPHPEATAGDALRAVGWGLLAIPVGLLPPLAWLLARFDRAPEVLIGEAPPAA